MRGRNEIIDALAFEIALETDIETKKLLLNHERHQKIRNLLIDFAEDIRRSAS